MALTDVRPPQTAAGDEPAVRRGRVSMPILMLLVALGLMLVYGWQFLMHPNLVAPTRDPAWYTWRANLLLHAPPDSIVKNWGPFGMFSGGYRVTTPLLGALLMRVAGASRFTFAIVFMVGVPILASLALAAFGYRHRRDPLLFFLTLVAAGSLFLTTVYVGYMDNITCLFLLAMTLPFLEPARRSWGARTALALLMFCATLTHPTTLAIFVLVLAASAGVHFLTSRFSLRETWRSDGWMLLSAATGVLVGLAVWKIGAWGVKAPFADAALPPPYPASVFKSNAAQWVMSLKPIVTVPLILLAIAAIVATARRRRGPSDELDRMSLLWLLPYLGVFGFAIGLTYPYYRFMNTTVAVMVLVGLGAWLLARWLFRRSRAAGWISVAALVVAFGWILSSGMPQWTGTSLSARWLDNSGRSALASVDAYVQAEPHDQPVVFIIDYQDNRKAWGWAKTFSNAARSGLSGDAALRSIVYFGSVHDYLANQPTPGTDPVYERVTRGFLRDADQRLSHYSKPPSVFVVRRFNIGTPNEQVLSPAYQRQLATSQGIQTQSVDEIGPDVAVVSANGSRAAPIDQHAVALAKLAGAREAAAVANPPGIFSDPAHIARGLFVILFMVIVPGLLAARWFELDDGLLKVGLVPGMSIAMVMASAVLVVAVHRKPFSLADGVASIALATLVGAGLHVLARRREAGKAVVVPFVQRSLSLFSNRRFAYLMSAVFLAVFGDGIVQGALAKTIAFGGHKGFDITNARSARDILALVLLTYLPYTFLSPFMGVLIDRFDRRILLVLANGIRAGVVLVAGLIGVGHLPDAALIFMLLLTLASTRLVLAIKSAGIPAVVEGRNLMQANSISQAGSAVFQIVGAGIAFVGTAVTNASIVIVVGAIVYGIGALMASRTGSLETQHVAVRFWREVRRIFRDVWDGFQQVRHSAGARLGVTGFLTLRTLASYVALVFALEIRQLLGGNSSKKGIIIAGLAAALGAGLGFVVAEQFKERIRPARLLVTAMLVAGAGVVLFGGVISTLGLAVVAFVVSLGYFLGKISADTITQQSLPDRYRGRGFSFFDIAYNLAWIASAVLLWILWTHVGARVLQIGAGILFLVAAFGIGAMARRVDAGAPANRDGS
jgi:MFS family permease